MSHASIIIALSPEDLKRNNNDIELAVTEQMAPFNENGEWFGDGSRWDWWTIGGRYSGKFPNNKDTALRSDLTEEILLTESQKRSAKTYDEWATHPDRNDSVIRGLIYGILENETRQQYIKRHANYLTAFAFLQDKTWREEGRLGLFGGRAATECEVQAETETGEAYTGRCIFESNGSKIISYQEKSNGDGQWDRMYWPRFIRNLPPDTLLVCVDYHV